MTLFRSKPFRGRSIPGPDTLADNESGVAAVEFVMIAPLLIGMYLGLAEMSLALNVDRQVAHSSSVAGDLVTQVAELDADDMADVFHAALRVSQVEDLNEFTMKIVSYEMEDGDPVVVGEAYFNHDKRSMLDEPNAEDFGSELLSETSGVIVASVAYKYTPFGFKMQTAFDGEKGTFLSPTITMRESFMLKPRRSSTVEFGESEDDEYVVLKCSNKTVNCTSATKER